MGSNGSSHNGDNHNEQPSRAFAPVSQRERLLEGMARTVMAQGYAATAVADVLTTARMSRRTFYEQFADKEDCFLAAYDVIVGICTDRVTGAYHAAERWQEGIERAIGELLETLAAEPAFAYLGIVEILAAGPRGLARREETLQRFVAFIDAVRDAAGPEASPPSPLIAQAIVGGIHELLYSHIVRGEAEQLPQLAPELRHYTLMLLGVHEAAV
jgi:AcrR family transcriptional regulator